MREKPRLALAIATLVAITAASYAWVTRCEFVNWDDPGYVAENAHVLGGLSLDGVVWAFTTGEQANWHPLTWLSLMLDATLFGRDPLGYHVVNVVLHAAAGVLLFLWLRRATGAFFRSWLVAALFLLHPTHVESVAWVTERKDTLSTTIAMLVLLAWDRWARDGKRSAYWGAFALLALGLLAKQMLVTIPCVLLLLDWWPYGRLERVDRPAIRRLVVEKLPFFGLSVASSVATVVAQKLGGAVQPLDRFPLDVRVGNAIVGWVRYLGLLAWPVDLVIYYPHARRVSLAPVLGAAALLVAITALAWRLRRTRPWWIVGWLYYVGTLVPVIGLVQVGGQSIADRYLYVPSIGIFVILAWELGALAAWKPWAARVVPAAAVLVLAALGLGTFRQVRLWETSVSLFTHANRLYPSWIPQLQLASAMLDANESQAAYEYATRVLANHDDVHQAWSIVARALDDLGKPELAANAYEKALELKPDEVSYRAQYAVLLDRLGRPKDAEANFLRALHDKPSDAKTHGNYGTALLRWRRAPEALEQLRRAVNLDPTDGKLASQLADALAAVGSAEEALQWFDRSLARAPRDAHVWSNRGTLLANLGRYDEAIASWERAIALPDAPPEARGNLAQVAAALRQHGEEARAAEIEAHLARPPVH